MIYFLFQQSHLHSIAKYKWNKSSLSWDVPCYCLFFCFWTKNINLIKSTIFQPVSRLSSRCGVALENNKEILIGEEKRTPIAFYNIYSLVKINDISTTFQNTWLEPHLRYTWFIGLSLVYTAKQEGWFLSGFAELQSCKIYPIIFNPSPE